MSLLLPFPLEKDQTPGAFQLLQNYNSQHAPTNRSSRGMLGVVAFYGVLEEQKMLMPSSWIPFRMT